MERRALLLQQEDGSENLEEEVNEKKKLSVCAGMLNITGSIIGSGTLAMPFALSCSGWLIGSLLLVIMLFITAYSLHLLLKAADTAGPKYDSYEKLSLHLLGIKWFMFTELIILIGGISLTMSLLIFIGKLVPPAYTLEKATYDQFRMVCIVVALGIMLPLSLISSWRKLRITSFIGTLSIWYLVCFVIIASSYYGTSTDLRSDGHATPVVVNLSIFTTLAMLVTSYSCHLQIVSIYHNLKDASPRQGMKAASGGLALTTLTYAFVGFSAYLHFGENVEQNVLDSFWDSKAEDSWFLRLANISMALTLCFHLPLAVWPWRSALLTLIKICRLYGDPDGALVLTSTKDWFLVTIFLTLLTLFISLVIPSIKVALSICGSVAGAFVVFTLPAMFYLKSSPERKGSLGPKILMFLGLIACGISFGHTVSLIVQGNM